MKRFLTLLSLAALSLVSCSEKSGLSEPESSETESPRSDSIEPELSINESCSGYTPLNFTEQIGLWLPYMDFADYMYGKSEEEYRSSVADILSAAKEQSVNTVYFHIHPNGDAYYASELFPRGVYYDGSYDPLLIMLEEAHSAGISVHGWLNPLRLQTAEQMDELPDSFITKRWTSEGSPNVKLVGERWYLDPSGDEVTELISRAAAEILENYNVDGLHIDDYFYPSADPDFDREAFERSGSDDLAQWRRDNVSRFVTALYDTVKSHDKRLRFGISPQGNIERNYDMLFADVKLWAGSTGYADYIVPQLYYGFRNAVCPFEPTLRRWEELTKNSGVQLIIGLGVYKTGKPDKWAGEAGENEWMDDTDIIPRQIELVKSSSAKGYALYK